MQRLKLLSKQICSITKNNIAAGFWISKSICPFPFKYIGNLKGKNIIITGGSRGIGLAIAKKCALDGANIAILAKTTEPHPKLPGTIYTAAKEIEKSGGKALAIVCDIRNEVNVKYAIEKTV